MAGGVFVQHQQAVCYYIPKDEHPVVSFSCILDGQFVAVGLRSSFGVALGAVAVFAVTVR